MPAPNGTAQATVPAAVPVRWSVRFFFVWLILLAVWEVIIRSGLHTGLFLPAPSAIIASLTSLIRDGTLVRHLAFTISRIIMGLVGGAIAVLLMMASGLVPERATPCSQGVPCSVEQISWFGFLTLPLLSVLAFSAIIALLLMTHFKASK